jgi:hypothetical protein
MKYRKLRIAWSVMWGVACLLLSALWVRSYNRPDGPFQSSSWRNIGWYCSETSVVLWVPVNPDLTHLDVGKSGGDVRSRRSEKANRIHVLGFKLTSLSWSRWGLEMPYWFPALVTASLAVTPWSRWRFSLRTLLIGITLVAVGLGLVVYASRN